MNIYLLSETYHEGVVNLPQIKINYKDKKLDLGSCEALVFSSKNGVKALDKINKTWKKIPSYAIGIQTAKTIKKLGGKVEFIAKNSYGNEFANEIIQKLQNKKTIFIRGKKVLSDLENILWKSGVNISSEVLYETICSEKITLHVESKKAAFIFTSPSTVECFFKNYEWNENYVAVCIGKVTAQAFNLDIPLHVSSIQTINACIELAKTLIKQN